MYVSLCLCLAGVCGSEGQGVTDEDEGFAGPDGGREGL